MTTGCCWYTCFCAMRASIRANSSLSCSSILWRALWNSTAFSLACSCICSLFSGKVLITLTLLNDYRDNHWSHYWLSPCGNVVQDLLEVSLGDGGRSEHASSRNIARFYCISKVSLKQWSGDITAGNSIIPSPKISAFHKGIPRRGAVPANCFEVGTPIHAWPAEQEKEFSML